MMSVGSVGDDSEDVEQENEVISRLEKVDEGNECRVGMVFKSIEEAEACYRDYGLSNGFSIRRRSTYRSSLRGSSDVTGVVFTCSCEGTYKTKNCSNDDEGKVKRSSSTMKSGCTARMRIRWVKHTKLWEISILNDEHNHALVTPSLRVLLRSNGRRPADKKVLAKSLWDEDIQHSKIVSLFGDSANVVLDKKDGRNHMSSVKSLYCEGDVGGVKNYFKKMVLEYPQFYYAIQHDCSGKPANFFWVDARARMAYSQFGDAVTFDTTYRTNKYCMPFAPFTGVNHHGQTIFFGCALLGNVFEGTFVWLFETWLEAMGGRPPISVITNLDFALGVAIAKVFPKTRHRFCLWHIKKKFDEKLSHIFFKKSKFKQAVKRCTRGAHTIEVFEEQWVSLLRENELEDNEWLRHLYDIREYWVPIYCRDTFFAGINTTQRSEFVDSFFNGFITSEISLTEFVTKYDQALESIYDSERKEDYLSTHKQLVSKSKDVVFSEKKGKTRESLLSQAAHTYTSNMFDKFVDELRDTRVFRVDEKEINFDTRIYSYVLRYEDGRSNEEWFVTVNLATEEGSCGCQLFNFYGIPCKHLMSLWDRFYIDRIPNDFIKHRWTKRANQSKLDAPDGLPPSAARINLLCKRSTQLAYMAAKSERVFLLILRNLDKAYDEIEDINKDMLQKQYEGASTSLGVVAQTCTSRVEGILVHPQISQTKGVKRTNQGNEKGTGKSNERTESELEMSIQMKKPRECKACLGHGHDSRNCKKFPRTRMLHNLETELMGKSNERIESELEMILSKKRELEMSIQMKKPRECKACQGHGHDSRNCKKFPKTNMLHNSETGLDEEITGTSNFRKESGLDMSIQKKKPRECKACLGHGHDSRNCITFHTTQMLHNSKTVEDDGPSEMDEDATQ